MHQPLLLDGTLDQLQQLRIRPMAWSCLGGGRLFNEEGFRALRDELAQVAHELNADSIEQVVYARCCVCRRSRCRLLARAKSSACARRLWLKTQHDPSAVVPHP